METKSQSAPLTRSCQPATVFPAASSTSDRILRVVVNFCQVLSIRSFLCGSDLQPGLQRWRGGSPGISLLVSSAEIYKNIFQQYFMGDCTLEMVGSDKTLL